MARWPCWPQPQPQRCLSGLTPTSEQDIRDGEEEAREARHPPTACFCSPPQQYILCICWRDLNTGTNRRRFWCLLTALQGPPEAPALRGPLMEEILKKVVVCMTCWRLWDSSWRWLKRALEDMNKAFSESTVRLFKGKHCGLWGRVPRYPSTHIALLWLLILVLPSELPGLWYSPNKCRNDGNCP